MPSMQREGELPLNYSSSALGAIAERGHHAGGHEDFNQYSYRFVDA